MKNEIELLKEQLNSISEQIKALESNPRFEIGKWHKSDRFPKWVMYRESKDSCYGIDCDGDWFYNTQINFTDPHVSSFATPQEIEDALIKEAVKRGFKEEVSWKSLIYTNTITNYNNNSGFTGDKGFKCNTEKNQLSFGYGLIFDNGKWAEILPNEVIKVGGYECKKIDHDNYSIGCKKFHRNDFNNAKRLLEKSGCNELYFDSIGFSVELINKILSL